VDGEPVDARYAPAEQDGVLAADWSVFEDAWGLGGGVLREKAELPQDGGGTNVEINWLDWYIIP
jgi:hypothetical protein